MLKLWRSSYHPKGLQGVRAYNLGTGRGISVLQMVNAFSEENKADIPYQFAPRRPGDIAACYANATLAKEELDWEASYDLIDMVKHSWNWQSKNPNGYQS